MRIDTTKLTQKAQDRFVAGWEAAGGYMDDCVAAYSGGTFPWCAPWLTGEILNLPGRTPEEWGATYWEQCRPEVERLLAEEEEAAA